MNKKLLSIGCLVVLVALFFAFNMLFGVWGRDAKADLSQGNFYTLTKGSRSISRSSTAP